MTRFQRLEAFIFEKLEKDLPPFLHYHSLVHTKDVLSMVAVIAETENISERELLLLKTAALFHDVGFTVQYKNHEEAGCEIARAILPSFDYTLEEVESICAIIMATQIPQTPQNLLEEIICDADLDYLGREDFESIAANLFEEWKVYVPLNDERKWNEIQLNFIGKHRYFRPFGIQYREPLKQVHLAKIKAWLAEHL